MKTEKQGKMECGIGYLDGHSYNHRKVVVLKKI